MRHRLSSAVTHFLSQRFGPPEHVLSFVPVPAKPAWVPDDAKVDYLTWLHYLARLRDDFQIEISNLLEIGANYAQDAWFIGGKLDLSDLDIAVVEPIAGNAEVIRKNTGFRVFECAVTEREGDTSLWVPKDNVSAWGEASLGERTLGDQEAFREMRISGRPASGIVNQLGWSAVDLLKIDVEGFSASVLRSLGSHLGRTKVIQLETERLEFWKGQETEEVVFAILKAHGFVMVDYSLAPDGVQADSLWINSAFAGARALNRHTNEWQELRTGRGVSR